MHLQHIIATFPKTFKTSILVGLQKKVAHFCKYLQISYGYDFINSYKIHLSNQSTVTAIFHIRDKNIINIDVKILT